MPGPSAGPSRKGRGRPLGTLGAACAPARQGRSVAAAVVSAARREGQEAAGRAAGNSRVTPAGSTSAAGGCSGAARRRDGPAPPSPRPRGPRWPADGVRRPARRVSGSAMASVGPEEGEAAAAAAREEQALSKLVVRLQNVQERKRLETLVQTLSDLLELAARQSGKARAAPAALPSPALPCPARRRSLTPVSAPLSPSPFTAPRLFSGKNVHVPLLLVVDLYPGAAGVQQVRAARRRGAGGGRGAGPGPGPRSGRAGFPPRDEPGVAALSRREGYRSACLLHLVSSGPLSEVLSVCRRALAFKGTSVLAFCRYHSLHLCLKGGRRRSRK